MGVPIQTPMGATGGAGVFTAIDNGVELTAIATAITTQGVALTLEIERLRLTLATLTAAIGAVADSAKASSGAITSVAKAVGNASSAVSDAAVTQQAMASSVIKKNNLDTSITLQSMENNGIPVPEQPSIIEQLKSQLKEGTIISQVNKVEGFVKDKINSSISDATDWAKKAIGVDQVIDNVKKQAEAIITPTISSVETTARNAAAAAGIPLGK
jgi:hypothetical protein